MSKRKTNNLKVSYGGIAKPLGENYFLMHGATHEQGGIGIGKDLEVENGEIVKVNPKSVKVLSNAPIMNGISPAQFALDAPGLGILKERFNTGFKYQEAYKDKHKLNDDGTKKAKFGKEKKVDKKLIEDVVRTSGGITGQFLSWKPPFINFGALDHAIKAGLVALGNEKAVAKPNANYTGVAMEGKGIATDDGLGFVSTQDLTDELGEKPVDFVDTYITGETPFAKQGVVKKDNAEEKRLFKSKLERTGMQDIQVFQTYKDTLDANTLAALEKQLANGKYTYFSQNTTYKDSPFRIGDTGLIYDGNNSTIIRTVLPDGRVFYKANDIFDTNKKEWNYKIGPLAKWGLNFIDKNTTPFMMTTPWYQGKADSDTWRRMRDMFGIDFDENDILINKGDSNGKIWDVEEALQWINEHPYEVDYKAVNDPNYKKLGGEMKNKSNKQTISSTGKKTKAEMGVMKVDEDGNLIADIEPAVVIGEKRNIIREMIISELLKDSLKLKRDKTVKTNRIKAELGTQTKPKESIAEIVKRITEESQAASNKLAAKITKFNPPLGNNTIDSGSLFNSKLNTQKVNTNNTTKSTTTNSSNNNTSNTSSSSSNNKVIELPKVIVQDTKKEMPKITSKAVTKDPGIIIPKKEQSANTNTLPKIDSSSLTSKAVTKDPGISKPKVQNNKEYLQQKLEEESVLKAKDDTKLQSNITKQSDVVDDDEEVTKTVKTGDKVSFFQANPTFIPNLIGAGINVASSLISHNINKKFLNSLEEPKAPYLLQPTKLKTRINVKPRVDELRRTVRKYNKYFDKNTASSQTAVGRRLNNEQIFIDAFNQIKGNQENQETSLINQDRTQQHETAKFNLTNYNQWLRDKTNFKNTILEKKAENNTALVQNIAGSATNFIDKENQWKRDMMTIAAISAGNPNVSADQMADLGLPYAKYMAQRRKNR